MFDVFSDLEWRNSGFVAEVFNKVSKTRFTWPEEVFGKTLFVGIYNVKSFDGFFEENLLCKETPGSSVGHSTRPVEHSKGQNSGETKPF